MATLDIVGSEVYTIWRCSLLKKIQNYDYKVKQEIEYLFKMRK